MLQQERLEVRQVRPNENSGGTINPYRQKSEVPPGWPDEPAPEFAPGEGLRWDEDFCLHVVSFPLYALPPEVQPGFSGTGSSRSWNEERGDRVTDVFFDYTPEVGNSERRLQVINTNPDEIPYLPDEGEQGSPWWQGGDLLAGQMIALPHGFNISGSVVRDGPVRFLGAEDVLIGGVPRRVESYDFPQAPVSHTLARCELDEVWITLSCSNTAHGQLLELMPRLDRVELGSDLFRRLVNAQSASRARWDDWHQRQR